jgi:hypothetical protein
MPGRILPSVRGTMVLFATAAAPAIMNYLTSSLVIGPSSIRPLAVLALRNIAFRAAKLIDHGFVMLTPYPIYETFWTWQRAIRPRRMGKEARPR